MKPVLYSTIEAEKHYVGWSRVGNNIRYPNDERNYNLLILPKFFEWGYLYKIQGNIHPSYFRYYRNESTCNDDEDSSSYTLTFTLTFPHDNDTVYLAHCFPYTYR